MRNRKKIENWMERQKHCCARKKKKTFKKFDVLRSQSTSTVEKQNKNKLG